ncbi:MAG: TraB/GumN family protein [Oscillospiraceae bacterium]
MKNHKSKILSVICVAAMLLSACGKSESSSKSDSSSSTATAAPKVTLPPDSQEESSAADESSTADSQTEQQSDITPLMWEVVSPDGTKVTMMGSMHALKDEAYPLPDRVMNAYESADILAVECDITTVSSNFAVQLKQLRNMYYKDGTTIKDHLPEEVYNGVKEFVEACGMNIEGFETFQLWALSSNMELLAARQSSINSNNGIDQYLLDEAHEDGKEIYEVESVEFQCDLLMNLPEETYQAILSSYSAETKDDMVQELEDTYEAWAEGDYDFFADSNDMEQAIKEAEEAGTPLTEDEIEMLTDYNQQLLYNRNITMKNAVETLLDGDKDVFYVVGLAHFAGDGGIIDLLEKDGYTVTQI